MNMPVKISDRQETLMQKLYAQGITIEEIANRFNIVYSTAYMHIIAKERGFSSVKDYRISLIKQNGYESLKQYADAKQKERQENPDNKRLSYFINTKLNEIGKSQSWLAKQLGVGRGAVSLYAQGKIFPKKALLRRLYCVIRKYVLVE